MHETAFPLQVKATMTFTQHVDFVNHSQVVLKCSNTVGLASGRASGSYKIDW